MMDVPWFETLNLQRRLRQNQMHGLRQLGPLAIGRMRLAFKHPKITRFQSQEAVVPSTGMQAKALLRTHQKSGQTVRLRRRSAKPYQGDAVCARAWQKSLTPQPMALQRVPRSMRFLGLSPKQGQAGRPSCLHQVQPSRKIEALATALVDRAALSRHGFNQHAIGCKRRCGDRLNAQTAGRL